MRIALCLSGQPRFFDRGFEYWQKNLLSLNENVDVFLHAWFDPAAVHKPFEGAPWNNGRTGEIRPDTIGRLVELYKPVGMCHEPQKTFTPPRDYSSRQAKTPPHILFSLHYSVHCANELKSQHEQSNSFKYDCVVRGRYDYALMTPLRLSEYDLSTIHIPSDVPPPCANDQLAFSSSENMDFYSDFYNHMDECWLNSTALMAGEDLLGNYLYGRGGIAPVPVEYALIRTCANQVKEITY